jgi:hypothetical protein
VNNSEFIKFIIFTSKEGNRTKGFKAYMSENRLLGENKGPYKNLILFS